MDCVLAMPLTAHEEKLFALKVLENLPKDVDPEKVRSWLNDATSHNLLWRRSLKTVLRSAFIPMPQSSTACVDVEVDYSLSLEEMLALGNYSRHGLETVKKWFPPYWQSYVKKESIKVSMEFFDETVWSEDVLYAFLKTHRRSLNLPEMLALGYQHPELQSRYPITSLGTHCIMSYNGDMKPFYPVLDDVGGRRFLFWSHHIEGWCNRYGFASTDIRKINLEVQL